jgi:hypothetical protein
MGVMTCKIVDDTLAICIQLLLAMKPTPSYFIESISILFDKSKVYYAGTKTYSWNTTGGVPQTRLQIISKFSNLKGFECIRDIMNAPDAKWLGAEQVRSIVVAMIEVRIEFTVIMYSTLKTSDLSMYTSIYRVKSLWMCLLLRVSWE